MNTSPGRDETYRVILKGLKENTEEEKTKFCHQMSGRFGIPFDLMEKIVNRSPIVIRKDLPLKQAEAVALAFHSYGASVLVEKKRTLPPIFLEFMTKAPYLLSLQSSTLQKTTGGAWQILGRVKNESRESLVDLWVLVQLFNEEELLSFEEVPLPINPLPPDASSPFRVFFDKDLPIKKVTLAFKNASGEPLPTADGRDLREWIPITTDKWERRHISSPPLEVSRETLPAFDASMIPIPEPKEEGLEEREEKISTDQKLSKEVEALQSDYEEPAFRLIEESSTPEEDKGRMGLSTGGGMDREPPPSSIDEVTREEEEELHLDDWQGEDENPSRTLGENLSHLEDRTPSLQEETKREIESDQEKETIAYPWIDSFREAIEVDQRNHPDPFGLWFEQVRREGGFESRYHELLTLLIYARFYQTPSAEGALNNTQKVFRLSHQKDIAYQEIPPLEGVLFFPGEVWRDLFIRAIPKLQEVSEQILNKKNWELSDLDRLIRIIPHMTAQNSRWAVRFIHSCFPEITLDLSTMTIDVNDAIYRVTARLGVVNPLFDYYHGKHSLGDLKIQAFARMVDMKDPGKIEEPLNRLGSEGKGGVCFPKSPECRACPFESFCPKFYLEFNPSEKGMMPQA